MAARGIFAGRLLPRCSMVRRTLLGVLGLIALASMGPGIPAKVADGGVGGARVAQNYYFLPEVRLRKFHLVRPDLIPFPVTFEVYC